MPHPPDSCASTQDGAFRIIQSEVFYPDGVCGFYARYTWDGVSVYPNCDGPIEDVRVLNTSATKTGYIRLPARRNGAKFIVVAPGTDQTFRAGQLNSFGIQTASDLAGFGVSSNTGV